MLHVLRRPTADQAGRLTETARQFMAVLNAVWAHGFALGEKHGVTLHHAIHRPLKAAYHALVSDHHIQARVRAMETIQSALTRRKQGCRVSASGGGR